jgi:hypothetical protein
LTIQGAGASLPFFETLFRIIHVGASGNLTLNDLTIRAGVIRFDPQQPLSARKRSNVVPIRKHEENTENRASERASEFANF